MKIVWETEMAWSEVAERLPNSCGGSCASCRDSWEDIKMPCKKHATAAEDVERERRISAVLKIICGGTVPGVKVTG